MAKAKLGSGSRFKALQKKVEQKSGYSAQQAAGVAAMVGRKKYGVEHFQKLAAAGKKKK